jgi:hypothetical protein
VGRAATIRYIRRERPAPQRSDGIAHRGIRDLAVLLRDVEVDANEDALALEIEVGDRELVRERHGGGREVRWPQTEYRRPAPVRSLPHLGQPTFPHLLPSQSGLNLGSIIWVV